MDDTDNRYRIDPMGTSPLANGRQLAWLNEIGLLGLVRDDVFPLTAHDAANLIREAIDLGIPRRFREKAGA